MEPKVMAVTPWRCGKNEVNKSFWRARSFSINEPRFLSLMEGIMK
jgi:type IV secretory pathway VirB3-like protein